MICDQFQLIPQILSLPAFIGTTEKASHVSDFRGQQRTDSRADKPDSFYGFDFIEVPTTVRTKTRTEIYTQLIGGILNNVRERITLAVEKNSMNLQNLRNYPAVKVDEISVKKLDKKSSLNEETREDEKNNDESITTDFEGLSLDDEDNVNVSDINIESDNGNNKNVDILSTFLSSLFLNKNNRMAAGGDISYLNSDIKKKMDAIKDFLLNRLVDVWSLTSKHFNFNKFANITETDVYDDKDIEQISFVTNSTNSLKSIDDVSFSTVTSTPLPNLLVFNENTKLAYQNAFAKYSNLVTKGYFNRTVKIDLEDDNLTERDDNANVPNNLDSAGIMLLEFFGTIAGLTWGAIAQVSAVFQRM